MSRKDYIALAKIVGNTFAAVGDLNGKVGRETVYENLYIPLCDYLASENPRFDRLKFSYAVGTAEQSARK